MKLFQCQCCGQVLHFENTTCLRCGRTVGYLPDQDRMAAVEPDGPHWLMVPGQGAAGDGTLWRFCHNWELSACNWMVAPAPDGSEAPAYCAACRHNHLVPDLSAPENHARWQKIEGAKRRLIYTLRNLGLLMPVAGDGHPEPLVFDFLADDPGSVQRVLTGHADGVVTIALTEADDAARAQVKERLGEAYRTLLGHFRHEVGHYYWDILVRDGGALQGFRAMFGDETADYAASLSRHYADGPPPGWAASYVSSYATMHPWEDWAETWAHYLHMIDTLETAGALGMRIDPGVDTGELSAAIDFSPYRMVKLRQLIDAWMPLTVALNVLNRSMGQADGYPFVLPQAVQDKLGFVHDLVQGQRR
ncbi:zinc-binding metallopeptidase family protein [Fuscibacter oryzae]|uniref:Putative zinc-binding peptidase n=1 Tax=Fuscibacter oryzae TaxID=2803939 RepID=A0A8J7MV45_9RHOB|nr:putative zinc-binding peptidase [Fuscibacter oryzae]MBL4928039.1 putative zinc-binding peptidase [Fuscibacter oryzae]